MNKKQVTTANDSESSTPPKKAARVKRVRNLANLSREEFCQQGDINPFTLKGWELGRHGGLTEDGANKIVERVLKEGVHCTSDWLMNGTPPGPYTLPTNELGDDHVFQEDIMQEISLFQSSHPNPTFAQVTDDALSPFLVEGDTVAGVMLAPQEVESAYGKFCILTFPTGKTLIRLLKPGSDKNLFNCLSTNLNSQHKEAILTDTAIKSVAPILRVYRKTPS